jgi:hypothetical protein
VVDGPTVVSEVFLGPAQAQIFWPAINMIGGWPPAFHYIERESLSGSSNNLSNLGGCIDPFPQHPVKYLSEYHVAFVYDFAALV